MLNSLNEARSPQVQKLALNPIEAAEALSVSRRTLDDWAKRGIIPRKKIGGRVLFPVDGLRAFLATPDAETA